MSTDLTARVEEALARHSYQWPIPYAELEKALDIEVGDRALYHALESLRVAKKADIRYGFGWHHV